MTREEAIQILEQRLSNAKYLDYSYIDCVDAEALEMAIEALQELEKKKGRWVFKTLGGWHCSECEASAPFWCMASTQHLSAYCPNCGTKMENPK